MVALYRPAIDALRALTDRPVIVGETGAAGPADHRADWLADGLPVVAEEYPEIAGLLWFDVDMRFGDDPDWRLSDADGTLDA